jgi:hypothetical protein
MKGVPFVAFGNEELDENERIGKTVKCPKCGKRHTVKYGEAVEPDGTRTLCNLLGFVNCGKSTYLVSVRGRKI